MVMVLSEYAILIKSPEWLKSVRPKTQTIQDVGRTATLALRLVCRKLSESALVNYIITCGVIRCKLKMMVKIQSTIRNFLDCRIQSRCLVRIWIPLMFLKLIVKNVSGVLFNIGQVLVYHLRSKFRWRFTLLYCGASAN